MNGYNPNHIAANRRIHIVRESLNRRARVRTECKIRLRTFVKSELAADCAVCLDIVAQRSALEHYAATKGVIEQRENNE